MDRKIEHKGIIRRKHIPYIIGGAVLVMITAWIIFGNHKPTLNVEREMLTISEVTQAEFKDYMRVTGSVAPIEVVLLPAIEGGVVTERVVEEGAQVKKGDVIVRLTNTNLDLQILNAEAELAEKQNLLRNTQVAMQQDRLNNEMELASLDMDVQRKRRNYEQQERLHKERLVAAEEWIKAKEEYELAARKRRLVSQRLAQDCLYRTVQMDQMEDNLANMRKNVLLVHERKNRLEVCSTIDGELGLLDVKLGQNISPGALIGQINDLSAFRIEAFIDEHYIDRVKQGQTASFVRDGKRYYVLIRKVFPEVREGKFKVFFVFNQDKPDKLRIGQTFYLDLELGETEEGILIPRGTFFQTTGGKWIFVLSPDGSQAYRREIKIGRQNPKFYEVLEGLEPGERVITSGYEAFKDNEILNLSPAKKLP